MPSTLFSNPLTKCLAVALLGGLAVAVWSAPTVADDSPAARSKVAKVSDSSTKHGSKLKWLPYRPSEPRADDRVIPAQHVAETVPGAWVPSSRGSQSDPFKDPFGDSGPKPQSTAQPRTLNHDVLNKPQAEPFFAGSNLQFPEAAPAAPPSTSVVPDTAVPPDTATLPDPSTPLAPTVPPGVEIKEGGLSETDSGQAAAEESRFEEDDFTADFPTLDEGAAMGQVDLGECPSPDDKDFFTPIDELTTDTSVEGDKDKPPSERTMPPECTISDDSLDPHALRPWCPTTFTWKASGLCHKPLYFEDVHLERYGHTWGPYLQPIISGAHFFLTVPVLPYEMALCPPKECEYTLGYYRPGNCAPYMIDPLPISIRAGLAEAGVWTGMIFLVP